MTTGAMTARFRWQEVDVHYQRFGAGQPVLLLHAMGVSGDYWNKVTDALTGPFEFLVPDLPFHGRTGDLPDPASHRHEHNAQMLVDLVASTLAQPVHIVGHSYGGASGVAFALRYPELVQRVVLIEPSLPTVLLEGKTPELAGAQVKINRVFEHHVEAGEPEQAWRGYMAAQGGPVQWDDLSSAKQSRLLATTTQAYAVGRASMQNTLALPDLDNFRPKTMVIVGSETPLRFRTTADLVRAHIPDCELTVISGAGHMSPGSHPADVAAAINRHLT